VRIWTGDIEIHISSDVAYAIWQYWLVTGDDAFLIERGAEVILDTARFWASRAEWNADLGRYELSDVIGPDENHEHVNNSAYTNYLVRWHLRMAIDLVDWLRQHASATAGTLLARLAIDEAALARWREVSQRIYTSYDPKTHLVEQFQGYFQRKDIRIPDYEPRTNSIQYILGIEGANQVQVLKQPDVLMLMYLLPDAFEPQVVQANYDYYTPRTDLAYGSSLGPSIQAIMGCRVGQVGEAYENFMRAARADLVDVRGNVRDGIHGASAGGLWQAVVFGFGGLAFGPVGPVTSPALPPHWRRLAFKIQYRGQTLSFDLHQPTEVA
jgi:kojibiose phosphorylase